MAPARSRSSRSAKPGDVFGRVTLLEKTDQRSKSGNVMWKGRCACGTEKPFSIKLLVSGNTLSCGCLVREIAAEAMQRMHTAHGMSHTPEFLTWTRMKSRCSGRTVNKNYAGRGIVVCDRWKNSFENFLEDMGPRPPGAPLEWSVERKDNDGPYAPGNCVWARALTQVNNRRTSRFITVGGVRKTISQWAVVRGINRTTIGMRLSRGWSPEQAVGGIITITGHGDGTSTVEVTS